jgi:hypothetical protein
MKVSKYEFNSKEQADSKIEGLGVNEEGFPTHNHSIVRLGNIVLSKATYDEEGNELTPATYSDKYHVDVLWKDLEANEDGSIDHPQDWKMHNVNIEGNGVHSFLGLDYNSHKF